MSDKKFFINHKKEFLITYPHDYFGALKHNLIYDQWVYENWDWIVSKETGHKEGDIHDHFHVYLRYKGKLKGGFSVHGEKAAKIWDVELDFSEEDIQKIYESEDWPKNNKGEKITYAHPNIKFKGDKEDPNCKNTFKMIDYVTKQRKEKNEEDWEIWSNFDWVIELKVLEKKKCGNKTIKDQKDQMEFDFCTWLRSLLREKPEMTKNEVIKEIINSEDWYFTYMSKFINYNALINAVFKEKPNVKPIPFFGKYWVPYELKEYLDFLNKWFENWCKGLKPIGTRPKALFLSGCGNCGKSSLIAALGTFSYWCNVWNMNNWESEAAFNFYDDFDISEDFKGNPIASNWTIMKPWIGGQPTVTISGKYKQPVTIRNDKPCVFVSNQKFEDRWPPEARKYWHDCGATIVDLNDYKLYNTPEQNGITRRTIGGYTGWVEYDTSETYFYKNFIFNKGIQEVGFPFIESKEVQQKYYEKIDKEPETVLENDEEPIILIESDDENGRLEEERRNRKRTNPFAIASSSSTKRIREVPNLDQIYKGKDPIFEKEN